MGETVISCELHDFVEVACMYGYQLELTQKSGAIVTGKAVDIVSADQREWLVVDVENGEKQRFDLMTLAKMKVLTPGAKFSEVVF